jgi:hypothetical protein
MSATVLLHQLLRKTMGTTTASLVIMATSKLKRGHVEEGVTAGPTYKSMGRNGSERLHQLA